MAEAAAPRRVTRRTFLGWWLASLMTATVITGLAPILVDRKSTRLNSSHLVISYAVFCLKKKKQKTPRMALGAFPSCPTPRALVLPCPSLSRRRGRPDRCRRPHAILARAVVCGAVRVHAR